MNRIVLDTNVLISGTFWTGASFNILQLVEKGILTLVVSPTIIQEYDDVLHRDEIISKKAYSEERSQAITKILTMAVLVVPQTATHAVKEDPDDDAFIDAAIAGNANIILSNDNHLLKLKEYQGIQIMTPEEFLLSIENEN